VTTVMFGLSAGLVARQVGPALMQIPVYYSTSCVAEERTVAFLRFRPSASEPPQLFMEQIASGAALVSEIPRASGGVIRPLLYSKLPTSTDGAVRDCVCAVDGSDYRGEQNTAINGNTCVVSGPNLM
jgi:hypothetical protein